MMKRLIYTVIIMSTVLMNSCGDKSGKKNDNPLLAVWDTPYETPPFDKIKNEHYIPAFEEAIKQSKAEIDAIISDKNVPDFANTIEAFERSGETLSRVSTVFFNLNSAETSDELDEIAEKVTPMLSDYENDIYLNEKLLGQ